MKKAIIVLAIAIIILPFMAVNPNDTTTHETKKATAMTTTHETTQADTDTNTPTKHNGNNTPVKHDTNADTNNNNKTCEHNYIEDSYITPYGHYSGYVCIYCNEGYYHLIDTKTNTDTNKPTPTTDTNKPTPTTDTDTTPTTDTEKENYSMSKVEYNNALYDYEIENGLYCEAREHYDESGNHIETDCNYIGGND